MVPYQLIQIQGSRNGRIFRTRARNMEGSRCALTAEFQVDPVTRPVAVSVCRARTCAAEGSGGCGIPCDEDASRQSVCCSDHSYAYTERGHTDAAIAFTVWRVSCTHDVF